MKTSAFSVSSSTPCAANLPTTSTPVFVIINVLMIIQMIMIIMIIMIFMIIQMISSQNLDDHQAHPLDSGSFLDHWPGS